MNRLHNKLVKQLMVIKETINGNVERKLLSMYEGGPKSNENFSLAVGRMLVPSSPARCLH